MVHIPVLQKEVIEHLDPKANENFIDCTIGGGGHSITILKKNGPKGKVLGIDRDFNQIKNSKLKIKDFKQRLVLVCDNFLNLKKIVDQYEFKNVSGILFDLGMSSWHLEKSKRGFSFKGEESLDMRYGGEDQNHLTAEEIVNEYPQKEIERILKEYGEERFARIIAKQILKERNIKQIKTNLQLVEIIRKAVPSRYKYDRMHFATRSFQALRIAVNNELENLKKALPQAFEILLPKGRLVVISFHSLEDRIVKNFFKQSDKNLLRILTKKPIRPFDEEIKINPRSRSARLRAAVKI